MSTENQLTAPGAFAISSFEDMERVAKNIAVSGMFGITKPEQAICLMLICQEEGLSPLSALRRYYIIDGKPSRRADSLRADFEKRGGKILWHIRDDKEAAATFFSASVAMDQKAIERARNRHAAMRDGDQTTAAELAMPGEITIIRTLADAMERKVAMAWDREKGAWKIKHNWQQSPRQMLSERCATEGIRLIDPSVIAGMVSEDEARDIAETTREEITGWEGRSREISDRAAMESIMLQHARSAADATNPAEKQRFLGLASEMQCKLADMDGQPEATLPEMKIDDLSTPVIRTAFSGPAREIEVEHIPAGTMAHDLVLESSKVSTPTPEPQKPNWREVVCHVGSVGGRMHMKKLSELVPAQINWIVNEWGPTRFTTDAKDNALFAAACEALEANPYEPKPKTAPASPEAPQQPAQTQGNPVWFRGGVWEAVIPLAEKSIHGRKLGEIATEKTTHDQMLRAIATRLMPAFEAEPMASEADQAFAAAFWKACRMRGIDTGSAKGLTEPYWNEKELLAKFADEFGELVISTEGAEEILMKLGKISQPLRTETHPKLLALWHEWPSIKPAIAEAMKPESAAPKANRKKKA